MGVSLQRTIVYLALFAVCISLSSPLKAQTLTANQFPNLIKTITLNKSLRNPAVNPITNKLYVSSSEFSGSRESAILEIDGGTYAINAIPMPKPATSYKLAVDSILNRVYTGWADFLAPQNGGIIAIDPATKKIIDSIDTGLSVWYLTVNPTNGRVYTRESTARNGARHWLAVYDANLNLLQRIEQTSGTLGELTVDPKTGNIYTVIEKTLYVLDADLELVKTVILPTSRYWHVAVDTTLSQAYIGGLGLLAVVSLADYSIIQTLTIGSLDYEVDVIANEQTGNVYLSHAGYLVWLDGITLTERERAQFIANFGGMAVNPATNQIFTVEWAPGLVKIVQAGESPQPAPPLRVVGMSGDSDGLQQRCYEVLVRVQNTTSQAIEKEVTLQETAQYFLANRTPAPLPAERVDRLTDCDSPNTTLTTGGTITKRGTIPPNSAYTYRFYLKHDLEWIERKDGATETFSFLTGLLIDGFEEYLKIYPGGEWIDLLKKTADLEEMINNLMNFMNALPVSKYTYTVTTSELQSDKAFVAELLVDSWRQQALKGSLTAAVEAQVVCGAAFTVIGAPPCAFAFATSTQLYFQAYGQTVWFPWSSALAQDTRYDYYVYPVPIEYSALATIEDTQQRTFAQRYLDILSLDRAALTALERAALARNAGDVRWTAAHVTSARMYFQQKQQALADLDKLAGTVLPSFPALTMDEQRALKEMLTSGSIAPVMSSALIELGLSAADQTALTSFVGTLEVGKWPEPVDIRYAIAQQQGVNREFLAALPSLQVFVPLVRR